MSTKEIAIETIQGLPEDASWQEIEEKIQFLAAVEKAKKEMQEGAVTPHEEVHKLLEEWITP